MFLSHVWVSLSIFERLKSSKKNETKAFVFSERGKKHAKFMIFVIFDDFYSFQLFSGVFDSTNDFRVIF